jgi:hypothetical protein
MSRRIVTVCRLLGRDWRRRRSVNVRAISDENKPPRLAGNKFEGTFWRCLRYTSATGDKNNGC